VWQTPSNFASTRIAIDYTHSQLKQLVREGTRLAVLALASYYGQQQQVYHQQAKAVFMNGLASADVRSHFAKYPTLRIGHNSLRNDVAKASEAGRFSQV